MPAPEQVFPALLSASLSLSPVATPVSPVRVSPSLSPPFPSELSLPPLSRVAAVRALGFWPQWDRCVRVHWEGVDYVLVDQDFGAGSRLV